MAVNPTGKRSKPTTRGALRKRRLKEDTRRRESMSVMKSGSRFMSNKSKKKRKK